MPWPPRKNIEHTYTHMDIESLATLPARPDVVKAIDEQIGRFAPRETLSVSEVVDALLDLRRQAGEETFA